MRSHKKNVMIRQESNRYIWEEIANLTDARTIKWPLLSSSMPMIYIILLYIYLVYMGGPQFMKNRKPYSLKGFIRYYNIFQVIINFWLVFNTVTNVRPFIGAWRYCDSIDENFGHNTDRQLEVMWWMLLLKIIDLSETVMFVLRKKTEQISYLHVYHHITTVIYCWLLLRHLVHGYGAAIFVVNGTVHMIMYSYYFLSTYGSTMQRILSPFKKWITVIQIVQIMFVMTACLQGFTSHCDHNKIARYLSYITFFNGAANLSLFLNFYRNSYKKFKNDLIIKQLYGQNKYVARMSFIYYMSDVYETTVTKQFDPKQIRYSSK